MNKIWRRTVGALASCAIVFAQVAVSAYACPNLLPPATETEVQAIGPESLCAEMDMGNPALCQQHCLSADQASSEGTAPSVPPASASAFAPAPRPAQFFDPVGGWSAPTLIRATPPPAAIRNCCLRI